MISRAFFRRIMNRGLRRFLSYLGPGWLIAVGYVDPGNWITGLESGAKFRYSMLSVVLCSNVIALILQHLAIRLGIASRKDLAEACRDYYKNKFVIAILYLLAEAAMIATDMAEVIGAAIALKLLFGTKIITGVLIMSFDAVLLIGGLQEKHGRLLEVIVVALMAFIGGCFATEVAWAVPSSFIDILRGYLPDQATSLFLQEKHALFLALGIIGATVMPHNLYLHSSIVIPKAPRIISDPKETDAPEEQEVDDHNYLTRIAVSPVRKEENVTMDETTLLLPNDHTIESTDGDAVALITPKEAIRLATWDSSIALIFAFFINSMIVIVAAAGLHDRDEKHIASLEDAVRLLGKTLGGSASFVFGLALLASGQSSTITGTMAGQVVFEGFLKLNIKRLWLRRLVTRFITIIPTVVVVLMFGEDIVSTLLLWTQVILSIQLPFAIYPLLLFTSNAEIMSEELVNPKWLNCFCHIISALLVIFNLLLIAVEFVI